MTTEKQDFLQANFLPLLRAIPSDTPPLWGKMTLQQMVEHFSDVMRIASGKTTFPDVLTPPEHLQKMRDFMMSEKPFKENTVNPLMPEIPAPVRNRSIEDALTELEKEIKYFFDVFQKNDLQVTRNPFFGDLNFEQNVQLLHKHARHHLKQFGVAV